jgi:hypothetical protein
MALMPQVMTERTKKWALFIPQQGELRYLMQDCSSTYQGQLLGFYT